MSIYKPPIFKNAKELEKAVEAFIPHCIENEEYPSEFAFAIYLGMSRTTLWRYRTHEDYKEYHAVLDKALTMLASYDMTELHKSKSAASEISLKRIHKLSEKTEIDNLNPQTVVMPCVIINDKELSFDVGE